jgi:excisionase family DNA binding protein
MRMPATKPVLTSKEVAHILDMSPDDVVFLARKGKLRATKVRKYWQYRYRDVSAYKRRMENKD